MNIGLGVDIGGSGMKAARVNLETGELLHERIRLDTPQPATPQALADTLHELVLRNEWAEGSLGCGFPAAIQHGIARTAANIDSDFLNLDVARLFSQRLDRPVHVANDADVAGLAEMRFGAGQNERGMVLLITIGTGLGTALFNQGTLFPNTELGHIQLKGRDAERYASDAVRKNEDLSWGEWAERFNLYLTTMEKLFWPDLIILGGGASKKFEKFQHHLKVNAPVVPAKLQNNAGIVGAAIYAAESGAK